MVEIKTAQYVHDIELHYKLATLHTQAKYRVIMFANVLFYLSNSQHSEKYIEPTNFCW